MQSVKYWPTEFSVSEPVARVVVDGQEVELESLTVTSSIDSAATEAVAAGGGGVVAATADVTVVPANEVTESSVNPWGLGQQLATASEIVVEAGYKTEADTPALARLLTAQVHSLGGAFSEHGVDVSLIDHTDTLNRDITIEPLLREYPSLEDWGARRAAGLSSLYVTDRVLRHCGFYATPPPLPRCVVSAPLMGSAVPETGGLYMAWGHSHPGNAVAGFLPTPWGMGLANGDVVYETDLVNRGHGRLTSPLMVSFNRRMSTNATPALGRFDLRWGQDNTHAIQISVNPSGAIVVRYRDNGDLVPVVTLQATDAADAEAFSVYIRPTGEVTIYGSNGASETAIVSLPDRLLTTDLERVRLMVPQTAHIIGGFQVAFTTTTAHDFRRTAHLDPPADRSLLEAFPYQHEKNCLALLKEQAEAELAAMWIDEHGHFRWRNRNRLATTPPVGTLTSLDHLLDLSWDIPVRSVFSRVEVEADVPTVTRRGVASVTVADPRGETLVNGDTDDQFFEPPADQDWHGIDPPMNLVNPAVSEWELRRGRGSYRGGVIVDEDNNETQRAYTENLVQSWSQINPQRWLLSSTARNLTGDHYVEQRFIEESAYNYGRFAGEPLPIIRARAIAEWDADLVTGTTRGPDLAPVFSHTVGPWVQDAQARQALANWLAEELTQPDVVLRDVPIVPDPRIQKGDIYWIQDTTAYQVRLRVLVMGIHLSFQSSTETYEMSQSLTCRVLEVQHTGDDDVTPFLPGTPYTQPSPSLGEHDTVWQDNTLAAQDSHWSGHTLADHDLDPLDS